MSETAADGGRWRRMVAEGGDLTVEGSGGADGMVVVE